MSLALPPESALVRTLPGEGVVVDQLVDEVVAHLNGIYTARGLEMARDVGEYLIATFFEGDAARFHARHKDHRSFRALAQREDLQVSYSFLWHACAVVEQLRLLPADVAGALPLSHHRLLLGVKDPGEKERLAREAVEQGLSKRDLEAALAAARPVVPPEHRPGRKPLPALARGLTQLKKAVALAGSEDVASLDRAKAKALLGELEAQLAALAALKAQVEAVVGKG